MAPTYPKKTIWSLALGLSLIGGIELGCYLGTPFHVQHYTPADRVPRYQESVVYWKYANLLLHPPLAPHDIIALGDSSVLFGVKPQVIETLTGHSCINLASDGASLLTTQGDILRLYVERYGRPQWVVLQLSPYVLGLEVTPEMAAYRDSVLLWSQRIRSSFRPDRRALPSVRLWEYWRQRELPDQPYAKYPVTADGAQFVSNRTMGAYLQAHGGWLAFYFGYPLAPLPPGFTHQALSVSVRDSQARMLQQFLALTDLLGIDVLFMVAPISERYHAPQTEAAFAAVETAIRAMAQKYPRVHVPGPLLRFIPEEDSGDNTHPFPLGADLNSQQIAQRLLTVFPAH